ncbi:uncharacterized protein LTR77_009170 [Saxophila tyrrhenica]|uniref:NECAP PHear domain-containing protein n=1 Tax=Saxophila tyrrhenica TaxID=1690608 RepID=A0AAV9NZ31_9PEZI|nr:hypothetical protein LTR77_009170 [Saxophila tyrrhenica]
MPTDPATNQPLPDSAIQRIVHLTSAVRVYTIPPLTSTRGFSASSWTSPTQPTAQEIFTARLRVIETSLSNTLKADIVLEDPKSGDLFAAAPYTSPAVVQQANDSSRFFAVRVVGEGGMKATLGIGFEERGEALDFNIALAEMRKVLGFEKGEGKGGKAEVEEGKDWSLKEGEKIHIQVGNRGARRSEEDGGSATGKDESAALFSIAPPPGSTAKAQNDGPSVAPPPAASGKTAQELGFDDGEFGEFQ